MKLRTASILLLCLTAFSAPATEVVLPDLTKETIVGVWEAIGWQPLPTMIERIEIAKNGPSFFAYTYAESSSGAVVFRMISCEITGEKISLRFRGASPDGSGGSFDWFFEGHGQGIAYSGAMKGRLFTEVGPPPQKENATFVKGSWTRSIADASRRTEEAIAKARHEATR